MKKKFDVLVLNKRSCPVTSSELVAHLLDGIDIWNLGKHFCMQMVAKCSGGHQEVGVSGILQPKRKQVDIENTVQVMVSDPHINIGNDCGDVLSSSISSFAKRKQRKKPYPNYLEFTALGICHCC